MNLDPQQLAAVKTDSLNALVIAGAGSGKTRVLIERIAYLVEECHVSPYEILCLTFTRKAAGEMKERLVSRIGPQAHRVEMGTMHAVALRLLHRFGEIVGLRPDNITVYSQFEEEFLLKEVATEIGVFKKSWKIPKKDIDRMFADFYERGKLPETDNPGYDLFHTFMGRCRENNALTYGGLLTGLELLIPTLAKHLHIRYILVDECQDLDPLQWRIVNRLWDAFEAALFVVGDIDQSIYAFRGAVPEYLVKHKDNFQVHLLESNYRSVTAIVEHANRLIVHNSKRIGKTMRSTREDAPARVIVQDNADSQFLAELLEQIKADSDHETTLPDYCVLARNHALLRRLSDELTARDIPHNYVGRKSALTNSEEFRRFHAFLKLIVNPYDNFSFLLIRELIGLSPVEYAEIRVNAITGGMSHFQAWIKSNPGRGGSFSGWFEFFAEAITWSLRDLTENLESLFGPCLSDWLGNTDYYPPFDFKPARDFVLAWVERNANGTIKQYLDWLATYDIQDELADKQDGCLTLCTVHAAKGLEWPLVIVSGCNEGILPSKQAVASGEIEEERRLMYVAITRARDQLLLAIRPERTERNGKVYESPVSRFVVEAIASCPEMKG